MLQLNTAEAADIKAVRATLSKNLESIDEKLDVELAEIREAKIVFDTRIGELISAINAEANQDVTALKADTAAMRIELEAIAAEAAQQRMERGNSEGGERGDNNCRRGCRDGVGKSGAAGLAVRSGRGWARATGRRGTFSL